MKKLVLKKETLARLSQQQSAQIAGGATLANTCRVTQCGPNCNTDGPNCETTFCDTIGRKCPSLVACVSPVCAPTEWPFCQ